LSRNLKNFPGNLLFLSVPDEEANSAEMLQAAVFLVKDAYKYTERLCRSYFFDKVSELVMDSVKNIILDKM
jgi:arginine utilization protein RocB